MYDVQIVWAALVLCLMLVNSQQIVWKTHLHLTKVAIFKWQFWSFVNSFSNHLTVTVNICICHKQNLNFFFLLGGLNLGCMGKHEWPAMTNSPLSREYIISLFLEISFSQISSTSDQSATPPISSCRKKKPLKNLQTNRQEVTSLMLSLACFYVNCTEINSHAFISP